MTLRIEIGPTAADTAIYVDGENIVPRLGLKSVEVGASVAGPGARPIVSMQVETARLRIDADPAAVLRALREEADRIEKLTGGA